MTSSVSELFAKRLLVTLKCPDREDRKCHVQVAIELHTNTTPVHRKELVFRLTDESDLFFLYTLKLNEEEFQSLKVQQGLLVDFGAFPQRFIDLLEQCIAEEHKEVPKFILDFVSNGTSVGCTANLNVIETNPFKHLTHLSLKFLPGTDTDVKKYLADCLKTLKDQNAGVLHKLEHTEGELSQQLRQAREALSARTVELDNLKTEWSQRISDINIKHRQELTQEREKALQVQSQNQEKYERDKRETEESHNRFKKQADSKFCELEVTNKELTDLKYKSEGTIRELRSRLGTVEEENSRMKQDLQNLRQSNSSLDGDYHEQEKVINQLRTRLAVMEQEIKDKEQLLQKTSDLLTTEQQQKKKTDDEVDRKKRHIGQLESSMKKMSDELVKGNEIIKKLQGEIKNYHTKLKLRNQITTEQEKLLTDKNHEMEQIRKDLEEAKTALRNKEDENKKLNENLEVTMQKLEESSKLLKTNEHLINWLNKQVTEQQLHGGRPVSGPFELNSTGMSHRPPAQMQNYSGNPASYGGGMSSRMSTSATSQQSSATVKHQHQVQYQGGMVGGKVTLPLPLAKSSPIDAIPEENMRAQQANTASPRLPPRPQGDPLLDKYLQKTDEYPLRVRAESPSGTSLHFNPGCPVTTTHTVRSSSGLPHSRAGVPRSASGVSGVPAQRTPVSSTRIHRDVITGPAATQHAQQYSTAPSSKPHGKPPLASAYFPNQQAKVT